MVVIAALAFVALLSVNIITVLLFWYDKRRAMAGERRLSEADLLTAALLGGSPGALIARHLFRHKTRKQPFSNYLHLIIALQAGAMIGLVVAFN